jgi:hypothetical protein
VERAWNAGTVVFAKVANGGCDGIDIISSDLTVAEQERVRTVSGLRQATEIHDNLE